MRYAMLPLMLAGLASLPPAVAAERVFTLDPQATEATFTLESTLHLVQGTLHVQSGRIRFDTATGAASGEILIDAAATETGHEKRDKKMHGKVLESDRYPLIAFRPTSVAGELSEEGRGVLEFAGVVSIHGSEHPLSIPFEVDVADDPATGSANFTVPYVQWGLSNPSLLLLRVAKEVDVSISTRGSLSGS